MRVDAGSPVAVVTGASAGIGRATALGLVRRGYRVALLARGRPGLDAASRDIAALGGEALAVAVDVADADAVSAAADRIVETWGRMDLWVNNAMATVFGPVEAITPAEFRRVSDVTYLGTVHGTLAALRHMRARDHGTIVQIGSALAYRSIPYQAPYCAAKFAVRGFTDSLRCELIRDGSAVRLTMVQLPAVNTPQFDWSRSKIGRRHRPVGSVYAPEAVAEAIIDAAEAAPREAWLGLPAVQAIVGAMTIPGLLDRWLGWNADGQISHKPAPPGSEDILFQPADTDHGVAGRFSDEAGARLTAVNPAVLRGGAAAAAVAAAIGIALASRRGRSSDR